jgi:hypothetical protein
MTTQTCTKCGVEKDVFEFYRRGDSLRRDCKVCVKARMSARYAADPEAIQARNARWRAANPERHKASRDAWNEANPERRKAGKASWHASRSAESRQRKREYDAAWNKLNADKKRKYTERHRLRYPAKVIARNRHRYASKLRATPAWANLRKIEGFYEEARRLTKVAGIPYHVDHIVPLRHPLVQGLHNEFNLQVLPGPENISKGNRYWPDMP